MQPGAAEAALLAVEHGGDFAQPHRRAVAIGDNLATEIRGIVELAGGQDGGRLADAIDGAGGLVDVGGGDGIGKLVDADLAGGERVGIGLDAHAIFALAEHL